MAMRSLVALNQSVSGISAISLHPRSTHKNPANCTGRDKLLAIEQILAVILMFNTGIICDDDMRGVT